jgi:hypothetical protein
MPRNLIPTALTQGVTQPRLKNKIPSERKTLTTMPSQDARNQAQTTMSPIASSRRWRMSILGERLPEGTTTSPGVSSQLQTSRHPTCKQTEQTAMHQASRSPRQTELSQGGQSQTTKTRTLTEPYLVERARSPLQGSRELTAQMIFVRSFVVKATTPSSCNLAPRWRPPYEPCQRQRNTTPTAQNP